MFGTPNYMAPEQIGEYGDINDIYGNSITGDDALAQDGLDPEMPECENCGHVHLPGGPVWVPIAEGACAPEKEDDDDAMV